MYVIQDKSTLSRRVLTWMLITASVIFLCVSCGNQTGEIEFRELEMEDSVSSEKEESLFTLLDSTVTGIPYSSKITEIENLNILLYEYLYNGGGVVACDINNDGLTDLYFNGGMEFNKLYLNEGNFKFRDITETAGVDGGIGLTTGITMVDINDDGLSDIYVCKSMGNDPRTRRNVLYINNGDLTFTDRAAEYGIDDASYSSQAYFFDMDTDGDLDLFLVNHPAKMTEANNLDVAYTAEGKLAVVKGTDFEYQSDRLYENTGKRFRDITRQAGMEDQAFGLSAVIGDFNNDLRPDIYVCNDYVMPDFLYINNGDKTFTESYSKYFRHGSYSAMGSDLADINNDGYADLITLDMLPRDHHRQNLLSMIQNYDSHEKMLMVGLKAQYVLNTLQLNNGDGTFSDIAFLANVAATDWSWSALFADYDNDGWKDLFVSNGYLRDLTDQDYARYEMDSLRKAVDAKQISLMTWVEAIPSVKTRSFLFRNKGNLYFQDVSEDWNSGTPAFSNGAAYADLDNDGYLDIIVNNINAPVFILKNTGKASRDNHFVRFSLQNTQGQTAYGTRIRISTPDGQFQDQTYYPTRGFFSSVEPIVHFGIEKATSITSAEIIWPDGSMQRIENPAVNTLHKVVKHASGRFVPPPPGKVFFEDISARLPQEASHEENAYIDFKREPLLIHKYSEEGPATATADANGDGLDDIYLGGAAGYSGKLLLQQPNGRFVLSPQGAFDQDSVHEDVAALFFDANDDDSVDLVVVSGGNEKPLHDPVYQSRLYINNGKGQFIRSADGLPKQYFSGGCVAAADIDGDDDLDLFIGGRVSPGKYPLPPASSLLRNDKGKFTNITDEWSEGLSTVGMVTDARFADLNKDGTAELILAGEWMPVTIFSKEGQKYVNRTNTFGLSDFTGWWRCLEITDVNNDGFPDIVAGNLGLNGYIQASKDKPATLHYKDFDHNGSIDPILCFFNRDTSFPVHFRDRLLDHMIVLKKKFTRYHMYADATLNDILTTEQLQDASILTVNTFSHMLFLNQGGATFSAQALPRYTQISMVRSIRAMDVNGDSVPDLVTGGNFYGTDAQFGRYDASVGAVLIGDGQGKYSVVGPADSGFSIPGNVRNILHLHSADGPLLFVARNNDSCSLFSLK